MRFSPRLEARIDSIPIGGLDPDAWIVVEPGVSREEVKSRFLDRGIGFVSVAIQDVASFCGHVLGPLVERDRVLGTPSRQEVLRRILSDRDLSEGIPELRRLKRQRDFYKKLDRSVQAARMTYSSAAERDAQEEKLGPGRLRSEMKIVIEAYESWLEEHRAWDLPRLLLASIGVLGTAEIPIELPPRIVVLSPKPGESRGESLWDSLRTRTEVERIFISDLLGGGSIEEGSTERKTPKVEWEVWHTVDDACDRLAEGLLSEYRSGRLRENGVLLPDVPAVRRSLKRALEERGLVLRDPRDPTRLRWEESIKSALLPLDVVARRFRQEDVLAFLHSGWVKLDSRPETDFSMKRAIHQEILDRGIRTGLPAYSGDRLERIRAMLELLDEAFSPRIRIDEVSAFHLAWIRRNPDFESWVHGFFSALWERFAGDLGVIGESRRKAPVLYWIERLRLRLQDSTPPFEKVQFENGVEIFRLGQTPLSFPERLWGLAIPPRYTSAEDPGDYYYSDRDREILSGHFPVRSSVMESEFRRKVLRLWLGHAREAIFLDSLYDWDGRERESIEPLFQELLQESNQELSPERGPELGLELETLSLSPVDRGSHPRWRSSYLHPTRSPPREIVLPELGSPGDRPVLRASDLEAFSRCEFQGLLLGRFRVADSKPADLDLRADARGTLLHESVKILLLARDDEGRFSKSASEALEEAWSARRPRGLFQSDRLAKFTRRKLVPILESFMIQETEYVRRSRTKVLALEEPKLEYSVDLGPADRRDTVTIVGVPDRIDEHPDGIFVIDYKTSSASPKAPQMIGLGYRLQMPIYALAAARHFDRPAIGIQFIELTRKGSRGSGIFFRRWNGKETGSLTKSTARSASLVSETPDEVWGRLSESIEDHARRFVSGRVTVKPKPAKTGGPYAECDSCMVRDACGQRRFLDDRDGEGSGDGEESGDGSDE